MAIVILKAHGMVGLTFLRQFKSWGAERIGQETWRFFLASEDESV